MGTILEFAEQASRLATGPVMVGLLVALSAVLAVRLWPVQIIGMAVVYFAVGLLQSRMIRPEIALVKWTIGATVCLTLAFTSPALRAISRERSLPEASMSRSRSGQWLDVFRRYALRFPEDLPLRMVTLLAAIIIAYAGSFRFPCPRSPLNSAFSVT